MDEVEVTYSEAATYNEQEAISVRACDVQRFFDRSRFSFDVYDHRYMKATVEYEKAPVIKSGEEFKVNIKFEYRCPLLFLLLCLVR